MYEKLKNKKQVKAITFKRTFQTSIDLGSIPNLWPLGKEKSLINRFRRENLIHKKDDIDISISSFLVGETDQMI